jgi:zinc/manganese transport system substrate-binding protein
MTRRAARRPIGWIALLLLGAVAAPAGAFAAGTVKVVASLPNLGSIAHEIGGDRIDLTVIASGVQDAHFVDPKPSYIVKLRAADLMLVNGLDLEIGWVPPLTQGARNARVIPGGPGYVDASTGIQVVEIPSGLSRAEGDVHPYGNPHYLGDPLNAVTVAATIADALKKADPAGASAYEERRKAFVARLDQALFGAPLVELAGGAKLEREAAAGTLDRFLETSLGGAPLKAKLGGWLGKLTPHRGRPIVSYHKDASYFVARFGIVVADYVEPKPGIQPSARHLEELTARLQHGDAKVILTRPYVEHRSTDLLAQKTGVTVVTLPLEVGGDPKATDYFALFDLVTGTLADALAKTGTGGAASPAGGAAPPQRSGSR